MNPRFVFILGAATVMVACQSKTKGSLTATPVAGVLVKEQPMPRQLVVTSNYLYWVNFGVTSSDGAIMRSQKDGSELRTLAGSLNSPTCFFVDTSQTLSVEGMMNVSGNYGQKSSLGGLAGLWLGAVHQEALGRILQMGPVQTCAMVPGSSTSFILSNFFGFTPAIRITDITGASTTLSSNLWSDSKIQVVGREVFFFNSNSGQSILHAVSIDNGTLRNVGTLDAAYGKIFATAADSNFIYFATAHPSISRASQSVVGRISLSNGSSSILASHYATLALSLYENEVLFADYEKGKVLSVSKTGTSLKEIASDQRYPFEVGADEYGYYWTNFGAGTLVFTFR